MLIALKTQREKETKRTEIEGPLWMMTPISEDEEVDSIPEEREKKTEESEREGIRGTTSYRASSLMRLAHISKNSMV